MLRQEAPRGRQGALQGTHVSNCCLPIPCLCAPSTTISTEPPHLLRGGGGEDVIVPGLEAEAQVPHTATHQVTLKA